MIRKHYINNLVLNIYRQLPEISFPISMNQVFSLIPNCKFMSYQRFAQINNCTIDDVITLCQSKSGCTHYDVSDDRYLVLLNLSPDINYGRKRWTSAHEFGHIMCQHHLISALDKIAENSFSQINNPEYENEADYFAATLLAPFPLYRILGIKSEKDVKRVFGLSAEAAANRYIEYKIWLKSHRKTAWENDIVNLYRHNTSL